MIVRDEEKLLARAIKSVLSIVDEIIIADSGSVDKTKEIAMKFNAKIVDFEWKDDFSDARNECLKHATKEWILVLDADEVIAEKDLERIKKLISDENTDAYSFVQRNYSDSIKGINCENDGYIEGKEFKSYFASHLIRLFKNKGYKFRNKVHELVEDDIKEKQGKIVNSDIPIHHLEDRSRDKVDMYLKLGKQQIELTPDSPKPYYEIAKLYMSKNDYKNSLVYFEKAVELLKGKTGLLINKLIFLELGKVYFKLSDYKKALVCFDRAIKEDSENCWSYFYKALILHEQGNVSEAIHLYEISIDKNIKDPVAYANLGDLCLKQKNYEKAFELLTRACELEHPRTDRIKIVLKKIKP